MIGLYVCSVPYWSTSITSDLASSSTSTDLYTSSPSTDMLKVGFTCDDDLNMENHLVGKELKATWL